MLSGQSLQDKELEGICSQITEKTKAWAARFGLLEESSNSSSNEFGLVCTQVRKIGRFQEAGHLTSNLLPALDHAFFLTPASSYSLSRRHALPALMAPVTRSAQTALMTAPCLPTAASPFCPSSLPPPLRQRTSSRALRCFCVLSAVMYVFLHLSFPVLHHWCLLTVDEFVEGADLVHLWCCAGPRVHQFCGSHESTGTSEAAWLEWS